MYLNFILTVLCLILLSFLVGIVYFWKKYGKKLLEFRNNNLNPKIGDPKQMMDSMKIISDLMKSFPKK